MITLHSELFLRARPSRIGYASGVHVLLIDDDPNLLELARFELEEAGYTCSTAETASAGLAMATAESPNAIVLDLGLPDERGEALLPKLSVSAPGSPVVVLTAEDDVERVVECMRLGALDFVPKPFDRQRLLTSIGNACRQGRLHARIADLSDALRENTGFARVLGDSSALRAAVKLLRKAAGSDVTVLIQGESGTGKEVAARAIHAESARRSGPFVAVNCGAIPEALIESELFGHEKGAFTGAAAARHGLFEQADGGTVFLDEIGELRLDLQVRLLRVLQERKVVRLGSTKPRAVNLRVLAATNRDLKAMVGTRDFREDLYYRLAVFPVLLPPLRERGDDVLLLARAFLSRFAQRHGASLVGFSPAAETALRSYRWPGNVRELENVIERAVLLEEGQEVSLGSLPDDVLGVLDLLPDPTVAAAEPGELPPVLPFAVEEKRIVRNALEAAGWNVREAARLLGLGRATVYRKIERYALEKPSS